MEQKLAKSAKDLPRRMGAPTASDFVSTSRALPWPHPVRVPFLREVCGLLFDSACMELQLGPFACGGFILAAASNHHVLRTGGSRCG